MDEKQELNYCQQPNEANQYSYEQFMSNYHGSNNLSARITKVIEQHAL